MHLFTGLDEPHGFTGKGGKGYQATEEPGKEDQFFYVSIQL